MSGKLILITGNVGLLDDNAAIAAGFDTAEERLAKVKAKWEAVCGSNSVDVYVLGSLFGELDDVKRERAETLLRKLPGRKTLIVEDPNTIEGQLAGWYEVLPDKELSVDGTTLFLSEASDWEEVEGEVNVHANPLETDTATSVCGGWDRWGEMFGLVNAHYLVGYAHSIGAGYIEG